MEKWAKLALQKKMKVKIIPGPLHLVVTLSCDEQMRVRIRKGGNDGFGFGNKGRFRDLRLSLTPICPYKANQWSFSHSFLVLYFVSQ